MAAHGAAIGSHCGGALDELVKRTIEKSQQARNPGFTCRYVPQTAHRTLTWCLDLVKQAPKELGNAYGVPWALPWARWDSNPHASD